jgi:hypothetical protein
VRRERKLYVVMRNEEVSYFLMRKGDGERWVLCVGMSGFFLTGSGHGY